jgi:alpha-beta hydrolase superfamily lysophospholipase
MSISPITNARSRVCSDSFGASMTELQTLTTAPNLAFDALMVGGADAPLVLLLHGFAESFHRWQSAVPALAATGYRRFFELRV